MNVEQARFNMVEQQIRTWEVLDPRILDLIGSMPREEFVPAQYRDLAFADIMIPLGHGQVMMEPKVEARLLQALAIESSDTVLEVGTGSGYFTALLARLGKHVHSVDIFPDFTENARRALAQHGINNVTLETGDAAKGWNKHAPYDVIAITGSLPALPETFLHSLKPGGRLVAVVGEAPVMEAVLVTRAGEGAQWARESLFETNIPLLLNTARPQFVF
ncbi:MAG: protein-L-isoaspartate O-methyltransferase [Gammaproteobacteria bacterium]|nr:protein-L-isoaspartate O-methyltransferase [Gammaproteobacteria bacterium]